MDYSAWKNTAKETDERKDRKDTDTRSKNTCKQDFQKKQMQILWTNEREK